MVKLYVIPECFYPRFRGDESIHNNLVAHLLRCATTVYGIVKIFKNLLISVQGFYPELVEG